MNVRFPVFPQNGIGQQLQLAFQTATTAFLSVLSKDERERRASSLPVAQWNGVRHYDK